MYVLLVLAASRHHYEACNIGNTLSDPLPSETSTQMRLFFRLVQSCIHTCPRTCVAREMKEYTHSLFRGRVQIESLARVVGYL